MESTDFVQALGQGERMEPLLEQVYGTKRGLFCTVYRFEADELWSFVGNKSNKQWVWLVMHTANRQIIAFHVGGRGQADAQLLWQKVPPLLKESAYFFTDFWKAYALVLDADQHRAAGKEYGYANHIERFNNTLRQRCSRLVRETLSFSKKLENHIGAIKYFICHYNQQRALLL